MSLEHFMESLEHVPPELERSFNLIKDLDTRSHELIGRINDCVAKYKETKKRSERESIRKESNMLFDQLCSYADDKVDLAVQTYELIDKNIRQLISLGNPPETSEAGDAPPPIGFDMPLDPNEPKYCICRGVSYGEMVACDNRECLIEWFHYACVGLRSAPRGKWYCRDCYYKRPKRLKRNKNRY